jgi:hypothetical protein
MPQPGDREIRRQARQAHPDDGSQGYLQPSVGDSLYGIHASVWLLAKVQGCGGRESCYQQGFGNPFKAKVDAARGEGNQRRTIGLRQTHSGIRCPGLGG